MAHSALLLLFLALPAAAARQLTLSREQSESALLAAEQAADQSMRGTAQFLDALAADLDKLEVSLREESPEPKSLLQISTEPQAKKAEPAPAAKPAAAAAKKEVDVHQAVTQMAALGNAGNAIAMPAMSKLLEGMYDTWKEKIGTATKRERDQKKMFDKTIAELEAKKAKAKANGESTKTYDNIEKYWKRQREIAHRQYHTALKIMHSGMDKFKNVKSAMDDAIAGKKPTAKDLHAIGMAAPEVVFLQESVRSLRTWAKESSALLHGARELRADVM